MVRFFARLNPKIANTLELYHYIEIDEMVQMAMKIERKMKRRHTSRNIAPTPSKWSPNNIKKPTPPPVKDQVESSKIQQVKSESEKEEEAHTEVNEEITLADPVNQGEALVCFVIIDGGSCTNMTSTIMVEKLGLKTMKHPNPYKLQWLNERGELNVSKQVIAPFLIGKYKDEVMCDVVPMHASYLLLGRPWQYNKRTIHDCFTNQYSFNHKGKKIVLTPLTPKQVQNDQIKMKQSVEAIRKGKATASTEQTDPKTSAYSSKCIFDHMMGADLKLELESNSYGNLTRTGTAQDHFGTKLLIDSSVAFGVYPRLGNNKVANFSIIEEDFTKKLGDLLKVEHLVPAVNQVELHPVWQQPMLDEYCRSKRIHLSGYSPLGSQGGNNRRVKVHENPVLKIVATHLGKSLAQVALRWGLQIGHSVVPKSNVESRIKENLDIFSWSIPEDLFAKFSKIEQASVNFLSSLPLLL
ncbi:Aldo-keto reductase family 4 member C11 [Hibiscus syriacus]|uniref:Aldo-keto reductase family 4 member C11 n=1 Tax=Hibiscus syriacus TaxID=106335 RepID=A0A6A2WPX8_HIBSY|nr:Aldo-keto reductase family 4 member C11 [Hibiscus syriacus]